jgi:HSP20 family protein
MLTRLLDPFQSLVDLQRTLDALSGNDWFGAGTAGRGAYPLVNVFEQGGDYVVVVELPGVRKEEMDIEVRANELRLTGHRAPLFGENISVHRQERSSGRFDRTVTFPVDIDPDNIKAEYRDGMLAVFVPRSPAHKPRTISIG